MERGLDARPNSAFVAVGGGSEGSDVALSAASAAADWSSCKAAAEGSANAEDVHPNVDSRVPGDTMAASSPDKRKFVKSMMTEGDSAAERIRSRPLRVERAKTCAPSPCNVYFWTFESWH